MRAGAAKVDITPPLPVQLAGYGKERVAVEIGDPLAARAVVVEHDGRRVALVSAELLYVERRLMAPLRARIAATCGIAPSDVMVVCTHTHSGPDTLDWFDFAPVDPHWLATLLNQLASAVFLAAGRLQPVRAELVHASLPLGINRRERTPDGIRLGENPGGPLDPLWTGLRLVREDGGLLASVVHHAVHGVTLGSENSLLSADWPGVMCRLVEQSLGGVCLFVNGACGDVNPATDRARGWDPMVRLGQRAGGVAIELLSRPAEATADGVDAESADLRVEHHDHPFLRTPVARRVAEDGGLVTELQALRLGPLNLLGAPGECMVETARRIQATTRLAPAVIAGYANDYIGYLPLPHIYEEGGYEPHATMLGPDAVLAVVAQAVAVADALAARG